MNILAIDLGKFNSMCCFFDTNTREYSFWQAATTRQYMRTVLEKNPVDLVVMEACGPSGWISDLCAEAGLRGCEVSEAAWRTAEALLLGSGLVGASASTSRPCNTSLAGECGINIQEPR